METKSLILLMFLLQAITNGVKPTPNNQAFRCSKNGNFNSDNLLKERDSTFNGLYKNLGTPNPSYPGYETSIGHGIWVSSLCPPHAQHQDCRSCVNTTIPYLKNNCPKQKEGVAWTIYLKVYCMVRYADNQKFGNIAEWGWFTPPATHPPTPANAGELEKALNDLSNQLKEKVKLVDNNYYGTGSINYGPGSKTLYAAMQCTHGMSLEECVKCLSDATNEIHKCCSKLRKTGGIVLSTKCSYWYEHFKFFP
ncbi:putative Gnk2-like domain-containing protein [Helianthus annuus]|nr:putative Gnk2-like domain-containing protein [Helianthus annuus]